MPLFSSKTWRNLLPLTRGDASAPTITCYDYLDRPQTHGLEQRYISPTTGKCRKLVIQAIRPNAPNEHHIHDHTAHVSRLALWLLSNSPFHRRTFFKWIGIWLLFTFKLILSVFWIFAQVYASLFLPVDLLPDNLFGDDSEAYNTGYYKPYLREFRDQLWVARSKREYSIRIKDDNEAGIITHALRPRLLMIRDPAQDQWSRCSDTNIIAGKKYLAISYRASDVYSPGPNMQSEQEQFKQEVRATAIQTGFNAYWLDLECIGESQEEKNLAIYCMADVYRSAESTLIMLGNSKDGERAAWERWGERVWTLPEALLSPNLFYKFRDQASINPIMLHQLADLAYAGFEVERAVINGYGGKDPLERLERLSHLKSALWSRKMSTAGGSHPAEKVYALMGFFENRIQPSYAEDELLALVRLSMANDSDRIAERMVSLLPSVIHESSCWYADDDVYRANLWDILPEVQVAGATKSGALVLDGCRAAAIRWKDFPEIVPDKSNSVRRNVIGSIPYFAWPIIIVGIAAVAVFSTTVGIVLLVVGGVILLASPKLFVIGEGGRVVYVQPWFIGVKGVLDIRAASQHLYGGADMGRYPRLYFTPSGSEFAVPDQGSVRGGSDEQYRLAKKKEAEGFQMYTLIDTYASAIYYFRADRPPTVCLFTGREGGLGRFVLCSERCSLGELHKESVLRMSTDVSEKMEMCGWVALG